MRVTPQSIVIGNTVEGADLKHLAGLCLLAIERNGRVSNRAMPLLKHLSFFLQLNQIPLLPQEIFCTFVALLQQ